MNGRDLNTMNRNRVELQHRHFCFIAAILQETKPADPLQLVQWRSTVNAFVAACKRSNSRFDADRFITACNHE